MENKVLHAINIKEVISNSILGLMLGIVLTFVPISFIVDLVVILIAFILIIKNGIRVYIRMANKETSSNQMLLDVLGVFVGFILLVASNLIVTILAAIYLIGEPIVELALVKFDKKLIITEVPKVILGVILLVSGVAAFNVLFKIIGIALTLASLGYLGFNYYLYKKSGVKIVK